jgi:hypothetical protein
VARPRALPRALADDGRAGLRGGPTVSLEFAPTKHEEFFAGNTIMCLDANSESDAHTQAQTKKGRSYWRPEFFTFGALVQVLHKFNWSPL